MMKFPDFKQYCQAACEKLWGPPDARTASELRWNGHAGGHSPRSFNLHQKLWFDHGQQRSGSTLELVDYSKGKPQRDLRGAVFFEVWREAHELGLVPEGPKAVDMAAARAAIESAAKDKVVEVFIELALSGDLNPVEIDELMRLAAKKADVKLRPLQATLKQAQAKQARQRAAAAKAKRLAERKDPRPLQGVPYLNAPWIPQVDVINATLAKSPDVVPPERDIDGEMMAARKFAVPKMHAFHQAEANPDDANPDDETEDEK